MNERFIAFANYNKEQLKVVKRTVRAYKKFKFISKLRKRNMGYKFQMTDERWILFIRELEYSFMEAGLA